MNVHHASNLQNYQKTKVIGSGLGMLKRASNPSQPIEDHPLTDTYDRGPSTLAMSFSSERNFCPPLRLFFHNILYSSHAILHSGRKPAGSVVARS